ncbi:MAG: NADP-dependent phosphogluconate dehydrogenase [Planctomycetes bacterium]|nr:NADP-dependent phosphogluconate dehydrogenase [Planctomycetota bacterium]
MHGTSQIGVVGLGTMGRGLALNLARAGFAVAVHDRVPAEIAATLARLGPGQRMSGAATPHEVAAALQRPRRLLLLVGAGQPVDDAIGGFLPLLEPGDLLVDAGNSHPDDTERREATLAAAGLRFLGMGVSGGEQGALEGPSLMPGGARDAYAELAPLLVRIAAQADGPCVAHVGTGAAGHFVKVVHNGIEYGDMQLIAECYDLLRTAAGRSCAEIAETFAGWNRGPLGSYLLEISARVLRAVDPATGLPMVDVVLDRAGQKGTGRWASELALRHGVPAPTIHAAVAARCLSERKQERLAASRVLRGPDRPPPPGPGFLDALHGALLGSRISCYLQGFDLLATAGTERRWGLDLAEIARIWKGGCILRARLLDEVQAACRRQPQGPLLLDPGLGGTLLRLQDRWRETVGFAAAHGVPAPAMAASLAWFDSCRRAVLPQNLTQAQRDLFGAHTFERTDRPGGCFHHDWP